MWSGPTHRCFSRLHDSNVPSPMHSPPRPRSGCTNAMRRGLRRAAGRAIFCAERKKSTANIYLCSKRSDVFFFASPAFSGRASPSPRHEQQWATPPSRPCCARCRRGACVGVHAGGGEGAQGDRELGRRCPRCWPSGCAGSAPLVRACVCATFGTGRLTMCTPPFLLHSGAFVAAVPSTAPRRPLPTYIAAHDTAPPGG